MSQVQDKYTQDVKSVGNSHNTSLTTSTTTSQAAVTFERVGKRFRGVAALQNISLQITEGDAFGIVGPNGAGKSTLLKLLVGLLEPDAGEIKIFGSPDLDEARVGIGYMPDRARYHGNFTGREYLLFHAHLSGLKGQDARLVVDRIAGALLPTPTANQKIKSYSRGMRHRLGLAVALVSGGGRPPRLLLLDEPFAGIEPEDEEVIRRIIVEANKEGSTLLVSSHQVTDVEGICSAVGVLRGGRLLGVTRLGDTPRTNIVALPRDGAAAILPHLTTYLKNLDPTVTVEGGQRPGEPLVVTVPTGPTVPRAAAMKAAAIRAVIDGKWDIVAVYIESKNIDNLLPQEQTTEQAAPRTGPSTEPLAPIEASQPAQPGTRPLGPLVVPAQPSQDGIAAAEAPAVSAQTERTGPSTAPLGALPPLPVRPVNDQRDQAEAEPVATDSLQREEQ